MTEKVIKTNAAECATFGRIISLKVDDIDVNYSLDKLSHQNNYYRNERG